MEDEHWQGFLVEAARRLNARITMEPDFLRANSGYGSPISRPGSVCIHRLIGLDEQHDGDLIRDDFMPEWRVAIRPRLRATTWSDPSLLDMRVGSYLPVSMFAEMQVSLMTVMPPDWVQVDDTQRFTVALVRYKRSA